MKNFVKIFLAINFFAFAGTNNCTATSKGPTLRMPSMDNDDAIYNQARDYIKEQYLINPEINRLTPAELEIIKKTQAWWDDRNAILSRPIFGRKKITVAVIVFGFHAREGIILIRKDSENIAELVENINSMNDFLGALPSETKVVTFFLALAR